MFGKSAIEEEKNVLIREREKEESALVVLCIEALKEKKERLRRSAQ